MGRIDTPASSDSESLTRMIALTRISERIGHRDARHALVEKILLRMRLFPRMAERLGIAAPQSPLMRAVLNEARLGCLECASSRRCRQWLDGCAPEDDYRHFCPNEGLFAVLPRQENVNRPRGVE